MIHLTHIGILDLFQNREQKFDKGYDTCSSLGSFPHQRLCIGGRRRTRQCLSPGVAPEVMHNMIHQGGVYLSLIQALAWIF